MNIHNAIYCQKVYTDETVCEECELYAECTHETQSDIARLAIAALEKQIPKKPEEYEDKYYACPACDNVLMHKWEKYPSQLKDKKNGLPYCLNCGQAINWSDTD